MLTFRKGNVNDTERFVQFLADIRASMDHKEWFYLDPPDYVREMMALERIELWLAMDDDKIAAIFDILHPGLDACNYGYDLGFDQKDLLRVINMDNAAVHPDYRGRGLQRKLMEKAEAELRERGSFILLCTIHPDNTFSLNNALSRGFLIQKKLNKYNSVRYFLRKDIP